MKKKYFTIISIMAAFAGVLSGCGDGSDQMGMGGTDNGPTSSPVGVVSVIPVTVTNPPADLTPEPAADAAADPTAGPTADPSQIQLLHLAVDLSEQEEAAVQESLKTLYMNLEIPEYIGEAIHMVENEQWFETMTAGSYTGGRSYSLYQGDLPILTVQIGEDSSGVLYADICFQNQEGKLILLKQFNRVTQLLVTSSKEGLPDGAFESWRIDSAIGEIIWQKGTYAEGHYVGELTTSSYVGVEGDAFDLWTNREGFTYKVSTVTYDEQGNPVATPTPVPTPVPTPTPKPSVTPPPKPVVTPTPVPEPEPDDDEDDDDDDDNNDNNGGAATPEPPQETEPPAEPDPPQGGDVDIGWSPDLD